MARNRSGRGNPGEPQEKASSKTTELDDLAEVRRRKKMKKYRRYGIVIAVAVIILVWVTGLFSASIAAMSDTIESFRLLLQPAADYPVTTGISELYDAQSMSGSYVMVGAEDCVIYTEKGTRLRNFQPGYAHPSISCGSTRFVLYNRSGTEFRVESRTKSLYTVTAAGNILQCVIASDGTVAAATNGSSLSARITVYSSEMETKLEWDVTDTEGTPLRMAFASDNRRLAVATLLAQDGRLASNLYVLDTSGKKETLLCTTQDSLPVALQWLSGSRILVVYDDHAAVYSTSGDEEGSYSYNGSTLVDYSVQDGDIALLLQGMELHAVLLDHSCRETASFTAESAASITRTSSEVYLCTDAGVECFSEKGEEKWFMPCDTPPQRVLQAGKTIAFCNGTAVLCEQPKEGA